MGVILKVGVGKKGERQVEGTQKSSKTASGGMKECRSEPKMHLKERKNVVWSGTGGDLRVSFDSKTASGGTKFKRAPL